MIGTLCQAISRSSERPDRVLASLSFPKNLDIGAAIEDLLLIWAATDAEEWAERIGFVPI